MSELKNSQRHFYKVTYAPTQLHQSGEDKEKQALKTRCFENFSFIQSLAIRPAEIAYLRDLIHRDTTGPSNIEQLLTVLAIVEDLAGVTSPSTLLRQMPHFTNVDGQTLIQFGRLLSEERSTQAKEVESALEQIRKHYTAALERSNVLSANTPQPPEKVTEPFKTGVYASHIPSSNEITLPQEGSGDVDLTRNLLQDNAVAGRITPLAIEDGARIGQFLRVLPPLGSAIEWATIHDKDLFEPLHSRALQFATVAPLYSRVGPALKVADLLEKMRDWGALTSDLVNGFEERMKIEPVGRLHLERLEMTPVGVERGELLYSVPLAPKETVNIAHKEWSTRTEEFENIIQDYFEGYSEEGVAEKNDIAMSTESQSKHANAINLNTSVSGGYFGATVSTSFGYNATSDDQQAKKDSRNHSIETTRKASSRTKKERKVSFKVASVAGTEDLAVRTITNPSYSEVMRVDYFSMMRKWRVDLYRYGLRMTYDIVIPNPGADLMRKIEELRALDALIEQPFVFDLPVGNITPKSWPSLATQYHAEVDPPPDGADESSPLPPLMYHKEWFFHDDFYKTKTQYDSLEFDVDPNYIVGSAEGDAWLDASFGGVESGSQNRGLRLLSVGDKEVTDSKEGYKCPLPYLNGKSGKLNVVWGSWGYQTGSVRVTLQLKLRDKARTEWQFKAWNAMREAAEETYQQNRQTYKERREQLAAELNAFDTLPLRRMEQEEIMKGVLRWLFGPTFELFPADIEGLIDLEGDINWQNVWQDIYLISTGKKEPMSRDRNVLNPNWLTNQSWKRVMEFGEFIKFLQNAIEWENMLYFLYPYFWDSVHNWDQKRFLDHPDPLHRMFLRAGCARVVLTIRPGFEESFTRLVETGAFGKLPEKHPYVSISQEIQNYAKTNYPGIPPANPENPDDNEKETEQAERGILIGRWYEYTPTSALDVSLNTTFADMG
jgi:hypothetical protein